MPAETVFIATPLDEATARRIAAEAPAGVEVIFEPDLLPPPRFAADHGGRPDFRRTPAQEARWRAHLSRATILWDFPPGPAAAGGGLTLAPKVRWVQTTSAGVGQMVHRLGLSDHPVIVTTASGVHAVPLAEFALMAILTHVKRLPMLRAAQAARRWERYCGEDLPGRHLLVVGAGRIGAEVARLGRAFGLRTTCIVNRPAPERAAELHADAVAGPEALAGLLPTADFVVLAMPHTPQTEGMIDAGLIAAMRPGCVLVNIARGAVIDEDAMIAALAAGRIGFAALDVARTEPLPPDSPLWSLPNVLISPHSASTVAAENQRIADIFLDNLGHFLAGAPERMRNVLDKRRFY